MTIGPVEYLVVTFPDGTLSDDIAPALKTLVDTGKIRLLDLVFLTKNADGDVSVVEFDEHDQLSGFAEIEGEVGGLIGPEDYEFVAEELFEDSSAAVILIEDLWAAPLADAVEAAGGLLVGGARIPKDLVDAAVADLPAAS